MSTEEVFYIVNCAEYDVTRVNSFKAVEELIDSGEIDADSIVIFKDGEPFKLESTYKLAPAFP